MHVRLNDTKSFFTPMCETIFNILVGYLARGIQSFLKFNKKITQKFLQKCFYITEKTTSKPTYPRGYS